MSTVLAFCLLGFFFWIIKKDAYRLPLLILVIIFVFVVDSQSVLMILNCIIITRPTTTLLSISVIYFCVLLSLVIFSVCLFICLFDFVNIVITINKI